MLGDALGCSPLYLLGAVEDPDFEVPDGGYSAEEVELLQKLERLPAEDVRLVTMLIDALLRSCRFS